MTELEVHRAACFAVLGAGLAVFVTLFFVAAPYGRHTRAGWGPTVPSRWGWVAMESVSVVWFAAVFLRGDHAFEPGPAALATLWLVHYVHRSFVFPLRFPSPNRPMPASVVAMAIGFNLVNAWINARWISHLGAYPTAWLADPRFVAGAALFAVGMAINVHADRVLLGLRGPGEAGYRIPHGGAFRYVTAANYFGELVEWAGWAIATWSLPGLAFFMFTAANLAPRAHTHHRWYRERFPDYPAERRALVPFLW